MKRIEFKMEVIAVIAHVQYYVLWHLCSLRLQTINLFYGWLIMFFIPFSSSYPEYSAYSSPSVLTGRGVLD